MGAREHATAGQGYDVVVLSFRLNSRESLPQLLARVLDVSLEEAKACSKGFPFVVRQGITFEAAEIMQEALQAAGARVAVEPHRERPVRAPAPLKPPKRVVADTGSAPIPSVSAQASPQAAKPTPAQDRQDGPAPKVAAVIPPAGVPTLRLGSDVATEVKRQIAAGVPVVIDAVKPAALSPDRAKSSVTQPLAELPVFADDSASNDSQALFAALPDMTDAFAMPAQKEPRAEPAVIIAEPSQLEEPDAGAASGLELDLTSIDPKKPARPPRSIRRSGPLPQSPAAQPQKAADSPASPATPTSEVAANRSLENVAPSPPREVKPAPVVRAPPMHFPESQSGPEPAEEMPWRALAGLGLGAAVVVWFLLH